MPGMTELYWYVSNLFYCVLNISQKSNGIFKVMIGGKKHLVKLTLQSISKFTKVSK